jgi:hypothetical protein
MSSLCLNLDLRQLGIFRLELVSEGNMIQRRRDSRGSVPIERAVWRFDCPQKEVWGILDVMLASLALVWPKALPGKYV